MSLDGGVHRPRDYERQDAGDSALRHEFLSTFLEDTSSGSRVGAVGDHYDWFPQLRRQTVECRFVRNHIEQVERRAVRKIEVEHDAVKVSSFQPRGRLLDRAGFYKGKGSSGRVSQRRLDIQTIVWIVVDDKDCPRLHDRILSRTWHDVSRRPLATSS